MNIASDLPRTAPLPSQSMDVATLVARLHDQGIKLTLTDGRLRYNAPRGALDDAAMDQLRARREEVITFLSRPAARPAEGLPASPGQARLWFVERAGLAGHGYVTPVNLRIDGPLDAERLRLALQAVVHRHEALRTAFIERDGQPYQVVHPPAPFAMPVTDLSAMPDPGAVLADLAAQDNRRHFDLTAPPLLRARLVRLSNGRHALLAAFHHIAFDGWSLPVFLDELGRFYGGETLPPLRVQLPDLVAAQALRRDPVGLDFWRGALAGLERTELPTDRRAPAMPSGQGAATRFHLPGDVLGLAREEGTTAFVVLLTAFLLTLGREAGQDHPAVGIPVANRTEPGSEALIGFLVNTLVLRADLSGDPSFRTLLRRMRATWTSVLAHQDVPFDRVVEALQPTRALSRTPLFATMFAVQDAAAAQPEAHLPGLAVTPLDLAGLAARFDLEVHCWPDGDQCAGIAVRDVEALDDADVTRLLARWTSVLRAAAASPDAPISRLAPLLPEEAARLAALNDTDTGDDPPLLHRMFEATVARMPDAPALEVGGTRLSYAELDAAAERIARALVSLGAGPDVPVVLSLDRGPWLHAALLGVLKAGACVVPLDPENPPARHAAVLALAQATLGIVEPRLAGRLTGLRLVDPVTADGPPMRVREPLPDNLAAVIFTSGSTGVPKGVEVTHFVFANVMRWHATQLGDRGRRTLGFTHQAFDVFFQEAFTTWALGGTLVLLDAEQRRDPEQIASFIEGEGVERVFMPFTPLSQTVEALVRRDAGHGLCELHTAGEAVLATPGLRGFLAARPGLRLVNHYGPTESYITTGHVVSPDEDPVPIGRPLPNLQVQVVDRWLRPVPPGATGEIAAGGRGVARGYRRRPDLTAERFRPDPNGPAGARVYLTGDRGRLGADGALRYLGRSDHQVKLRGFRVEPAEVQRILMDGPELRAATVGLLNGALVAHVVLADPSGNALAAVRVRLGERLPDYMRPAAIVTLPALPLLQNGKVDRFALPTPETASVDLPRSATEEALVGLFAEVLGRPAVGIHEDFFSAGGHSLLATQLVSRIRAVLGVELPLRALFEAPSVAAVAAAMEAADAPPEPPRAGLAPANLAPLSFAQARLWLLDRLGLAGYAYTIPVALRLRGALDIPALAAALVDLVVRHEPLRTACREVDGEPAQWVLPPPDAHLDVREAAEADLPGLQAAEIAAPFDLAAGRPFRMRLLRLGADDFVLLGAIHHIAADGWSLQVIVRELGSLYRHRAFGAAAPAALPLRYADFACWQRGLMRGEREAAHLDYWRGRLAGAPPLVLPLDRPRPVRETFRGTALPVQVHAGLAGRIATLCRAEGTTPFMTLLAAFQALLHRLSGQARFVVGAPIANRNRGETEGLVGFFVNAMGLDADCGDDPRFSTHLGRVREVCLGAFAHQDLPFERVVQDLAPGRNLSSNPVFNTIFVVQAGDTMAPRFDLPGIAVEVVPPPDITVRFDMELHLWPQDGGFVGFFAYNRDLFERATIEVWIAGYLALLEGAVAAPATRLSALPLTPPGGRAASLIGPAAVRCDLPGRFAAMVAADPGAVALVGDGFALTYRELDRQAEDLAGRLVAAGVGAEAVVALALERGVEAIIAMLGVLKAGAAYLPLDPGMPVVRREAILADAGVVVVLGPGLGVGDGAGLGVGAVLDGFAWISDSVSWLGLARRPTSTGADGGKVVGGRAKPGHDTGAGAEASTDSGALSPDRLACLIYTSGTTGAAKGVAVTHGNIASRCVEPDFMSAGAGEVVLQYAPLAFDASTLEIWGPLLNGGTVAIAPAGRLTLAELAGFLDRQAVTRLWLTAGLFREMALAQPEALRKRRQILAGGDVVAPEAVRAVLGDGAVFRNGYGPTETTIFALTHSVTDAAAVDGGVPIGRPVAGTRVHLLDAAGCPVPPSVPGEICVGGAGVARGYLGQPGATADRFRPDPLSVEPGGRLYRTGDRGRMRWDGAVEFLGRMDRQVKIRGFRVEPGEVEAALLAQPSVAQAVVAAQAGADGERRLTAWVVPAGADRDGHLRGWADLFDQRIYGDSAPVEAGFDITGWISTYTGAPISAAEMREWVEDTVTQVLARRPAAVLEPGCGTGLLLRRIAPHTERYIGTDASQVALDRLGVLPGVALRRQDAADFSGIEAEVLDCVLLSSVVQYFPDLSYLREVIAGALRALRAGGVVHLADLRDLRHHRRLTLASEVARAEDATPAGVLRDAAERRLAQEAELLVDPALFSSLPGVAAAELRLQSGSAHNELTRYRFTAVLYAEAPDWQVVEAAPVRTLAGLEGLLSEGMPVVATGLPNARLTADIAVAAVLERASPSMPAAGLRAAAEQEVIEAVDPADVLALAARFGLACVLAPSADPDCFDVGFHEAGAPPPWMPSWRKAAVLPDLLANRPVGTVAGLVPALREALRQVLPAPMVPDAFVVLPRLPLTPTGKIDRAALPVPSRQAAAFAPPRDATEQAVAEVFAQALGLQRVGRDDDFFALGGHSLLAARISALLRQRLGREVPLRLFFEAPTVAALAERLGGLEQAADAALVQPDPVSRHLPFPLTDVQQAYWIGRDGAFAVGGTAAHVYFEVDAKGLDIERFEAAWNGLVRRHGMLRAVVAGDGTQRILSDVPLYVIPRHSRADGVRERLAEEVPPSNRWPLFRLEASRLADDTGWRLHVGIDTLVVDAHSLNLMFVELRQMYDYAVRLPSDGSAGLPPLTLSFRDVVLARLAAQESEAYGRSRAYWMARLDTLPAAPALPMAPVRPSGAPRFVLLSHRVEAAVWTRIRERAAARGLSPNSVVLTAFAEALAGWSRDPDFTLNLTRFERPPLHPEMQSLVGDFTELLLLAVSSQPGVGFAAAAARLQHQLWEDLEHPHPGAVALAREISRRQGRPPDMLFPVVFTSLLGLPGGAAGEDALQRFGPVSYRAAQTPQVWLDHGVAEIAGDLALTWNVLEGAFPDGVVEAMFGAYLRILHALAGEEAAWDRPAARDLPAAQQAGRARYNATRVPRQPALLHAGLLRAAEAYPERPAVIAGDRVLTHGELAARARGLALRLLGMGIGRGDIVAVALRKGWEQAVATLAVLQAGAAYLPMDPGLPAERLHLLLADAGVRVVLSHSELDREAWPSGVAHLAVDLALPEPGAALVCQASPDDLAYVIYTSGSTGRPKGVAMTHAATANTLADLEHRLALSLRDRVLALSALSFDLSVWDLFGVPGAGGAAVIPVGDEERDPRAWARLAARHGVTVWNSVPQLLQMRFDAADGEAPVARVVMLSGDWIPLPLVDTVRSRWPGARLISLGGATEAAIWSILHDIGPADPAWPSVPYGRPMENQTIDVLGPDLTPRPDWAEGEIYIGGVGLARAYLGDAERTAVAFVTHPETGVRLYRTGDMGRFRPGGLVEFLGRRDGQVKVNGFRIELGEVEAALAAAPGVAQAAATVTKDAAGGPALCGFVVPRSGEAAMSVLSAGALADAAAAALKAAPEEPVTAAVRELWSAEADRYVRSAEAALASLGVFQSTDERWEVPALLGRTGIAWRYTAWLERALGQLVARGVLVRRGPAWVALRPLKGDAAGEELASVLTERVHSAELYADPAVPELYERIFGGCHRALAAAFSVLLARLPSDRPVRVLEVGAGYGTATRHLLPLLPVGRAEYRFTDVSRFFLDRAADAFSGIEGLEFGLLDLDRPAAAQGVPPGSVDIIVAASVLHDARRIEPMLTDLAATLAPGGVLLAIEETVFHPAYDLGMGLQQGFDRMADRDLRPEHPLLSRAAWAEVLERSGFAASRCVARPGSIPEALGFAVLLAQASETSRGLSETVVLEHARRRLPEHMVPRGVIVLPALPLSANGKLDRAALAALVPGREVAVGLAPRNALEAALLAIWAKLLGAEQLGVDSDLFVNGADSLVTTRAVSLMRAATGVDLPLRTVFEQPTVAALAAAVEVRQWAAEDASADETAVLL